MKHANFLGDWDVDCPNPWLPVVDGQFKNIEMVFVPKNPYQIIQSGSFNKMPIIIGHVKDEGIKYSAQRLYQVLNFIFQRPFLWAKIPPRLNICGLFKRSLGGSVQDLAQE